MSSHYDEALLVYTYLAPATDPAVSAAGIAYVWLTLGAAAPKPVCSPQLCEYQRGEDAEGRGSNKTCSHRPIA